MSLSVVFILMLFAHIVDDFYLQGILAKMKQKSWWREQPEYKDMYSGDYICALFIHSLSWAIMISLPILFATAFNCSWWLYLVIGCNTVIPR